MDDIQFNFQSRDEVLKVQYEEDSGTYCFETPGVYEQQFGYYKREQKRSTVNLF